MTNHLPIYISLGFVLTTLMTLVLFIRTIRRAKSESVGKLFMKILAGLITWLLIQAILTVNNVYSAGISSFPPSILVSGVLPAIVTILVLFVTQKGRQFIDGLPLKNLTYLHVVRIPVELVLYCLYIYKTVPELMTFAGRNFDIIAGISAAFIAYLGFAKNNISRPVLLAWNCICLVLLLNIVVTAVLSAPTTFQKFAFDQPNIAILYFPFSWLPTFIVPVILFAHLSSIRQLVRVKKIEPGIKAMDRF